MKIAVIRTGGKQYVVKEKDRIKMEKLAAADGAKVALDALLVADGDEVAIGAPVLDSHVGATVLGQGRSRKVTGTKYKRKTREHKTFGHRQSFTELLIETI